MTIDLKGRIVAAVEQRPIYGAVVEVSSTGQRPAFKPRQVTTNRMGSFHFRIRADEVGTDGNAPTVLLRVLDGEGKEIGFAQPNVEAHDLTIEIGEAAIQTARLPRQPGEVAIISADVFDTIRAATSKASTPPQITVNVAAMDNVFSSLPPLLALPDLIDIAQGVLRGRSEDFSAFEELLDDLEAWNHQAYPYVRRQLTHNEAEHVLSPAFLRASVDTAGARPKRAREPVISREALFVTIAAAMRVARGNPQRVIGNIGILLEQYCGLGPVVSLYHAAQLALAGGEVDRRMFLARLGTYGGGWVEPPVPDGPQPPAPRVPPRPFPCPGGPPWPPDPGSSGGVPWAVDECEPEIIRATQEALARRRIYSITGISPQGACPGETITITGTGLTFEGQGGICVHLSRCL
jgi:hypothetical protein